MAFCFLGELEVDAKAIKLSELRDIIQYQRNGHMNRRSLMFQEALFIMSRLPNYYNKPKGELTKWQFGYVEKGSENVKMLPASAEQQTLFAAVPELFNVDLVVVPLSQIPPDFVTSESQEGNSSQQDTERSPVDGSEVSNKQKVIAEAIEAELPTNVA
jgi:hypothetical protein